MKIHMFDASNGVSPQKTATDWNKGGSINLVAMTQGGADVVTREEDSQTNFGPTVSGT